MVVKDHVKVVEEVVKQKMPSYTRRGLVVLCDWIGPGKFSIREHKKKLSGDVTMDDVNSVVEERFKKGVVKKKILKMQRLWT